MSNNKTKKLNNDIIDKVAMMSKSEKLKLKKNEELAKESVLNNKGRKVKIKVLHYDIKDNDSDLTISCKSLINKNKITNKDVYDVYGRSDGWNLIYGSEKTIGWDRVKKWADLLGYDVNISFTKKEED